MRPVPHGAGCLETGIRVQGQLVTMRPAWLSEEELGEGGCLYTADSLPVGYEPTWGQTNVGVTKKPTVNNKSL